MLPDSAYFQEIPRTQQPLNSPVHLHPRSRPSHKELLSNFVNPSAAAFPSPPEQDVVRRMPPQSSNSPTPNFASRRSAFTPFKTPNTLQDVRDIYRIGNVQNRSQASGLLTPTSHLLHHPIQPTYSNEPNNGIHSYVVDELPSQRTFRPRVLCSQFPVSTVLIPSEELPESKDLVSKSEKSPSSRFIYPEPLITVQNEDIKPLPSSHVYDPIRDSWTPIDIQEDSPKVITEPMLTCNTVSTEVELIHEEVSRASPQLGTSPNLQAHETTSKSQPEMISSSWNDFSACNSLPSALPSSPPLSPVTKSNKRRISLSSDSDTYGNPSKLRKKLNSEETEETKATPPKAEPIVNSHQDRFGLSNLSELCNNNAASTDPVDLDFIQEYYKQCEPSTPSDIVIDDTEDKTPDIKDEKAPKSLGQISSMQREEALESHRTSLVEHEQDFGSFEEESMFDVDGTIESIESFLTKDVDIFGGISEENPTTSNWSIISNRRKPISSLLLSDTSDPE